MKWLEKIERCNEVDLSIEWKVFPLEQVNQNQGEGFRIWEHPEYPARGIAALTAAKAASRQGDALFDKFHRLVFKAYHSEGKDISQKPVLTAAAVEAGLDVQKFEKDLDLRETLESLGRDYQEARQSHNLFGVPTFVFENDEAIYVKLESVPETETEGVNLLKHIFRMGLEMPYLLELKKP